MKFQTKKGYGFFEATSAFQKAIRLNDENIALYFMVEFFNSGYDEYLWKRIKVITSEDIGLASQSMPAVIDGLYNSYSELKKDNKENKPERLFLTHAVILLCRAKKSRLVDWAMINYWRQHDSVNIEVPAYAYDMHNQKGKAMGLGIEHFYEVGTKLENHLMQPGEEEMKKKAFEYHKLSPGKLKFETRKRGDKPAEIIEIEE